MARACCRRWSRSLPRTSDAYVSDDEDEDDDAGPASVCSAAAAGPEDAYAAPADERRTDDTDYGFDEFGFEMEDDEVYAELQKKLYNKNEPAAAASSTPDGTSDAGSTSDSSDDGSTSDGDDRIYSLWGEDEITAAFYEEYPELNN